MSTHHASSSSSSLSSSSSVSGAAAVPVDSLKSFLDFELAAANNAASSDDINSSSHDASNSSSSSSSMSSSLEGSSSNSTSLSSSSSLSTSTPTTSTSIPVLWPNCRSSGGANDVFQCISEVLLRQPRKFANIVRLSPVLLEVIDRLVREFKDRVDSVPYSAVVRFVRLLTSISSLVHHLRPIIQQALDSLTLFYHNNNSYRNSSNSNNSIFNRSELDILSLGDYISSIRVLYENKCVGQGLHLGYLGPLLTFTDLVELLPLLQQREGGGAATTTASATILHVQFLCVEVMNLSRYWRQFILESNVSIGSNDLDTSLSIIAASELKSPVEEISYSPSSQQQQFVRPMSISEIVDENYFNSVFNYPFSCKSLLIAEYLLSSSRATPYSNSPVVKTTSTMRNLRRIAKSLWSYKPIIVQGPVGCGKSFLIRELAIALGQDKNMIELHLDDQVDSKSLLGSYICSDVPGEFRWQNGVITQAVLNGYWVLIEDIDKISIDVIASLASLLEHRKLYLPSLGREIDAHTNFRLIGTRIMSTESENNQPQTRSLSSSSAAGGGGVMSEGEETDASPSDSLNVADASISTVHFPSLRNFSHNFYYVTFENLSTEEIRLILIARYPHMLESIVNTLLRIHQLFTASQSSSHSKSSSSSSAAAAAAKRGGDSSVSGFESDNSNNSELHNILKKARKFTARDVLKVAHRISLQMHEFNLISGLLTDTQRVKCALEVIDIFASSIRDASTYKKVTKVIAWCWDIPQSEIESFILQSKPQIHNSMDSSTIVIGRVSLKRNSLSRDTVMDSSTSQLDSSRRSANDISQQDYAYTDYSLRILEKIGACVAADEPVLLVGETGAGKTTSVQELANLLQKTLMVQNLSLSTDASDLFGGFRPVNIKQLLQPTFDNFVTIFQSTFPNSSDYMQIVIQYFSRQKWSKLLGAFDKACQNAHKKLSAALNDENSSAIDKDAVESRLSDWQGFHVKVLRLITNLPKIEHGFAFAFVDGLIVEAMKRGYWVLLDEINLASAETLQGLAGILEGQSICLTETGEIEPITRHPDFRVFAAMNPPTDVGKRELTLSLRCRFTELYIDEMLDSQDLRSVVLKFFGGHSEVPIDAIIDAYLNCRHLSETKFVDGAGLRPRYSLRSLTRSLKAAKQFFTLGLRPLTRALYEGFLLNFMTLLGNASDREFLCKSLKDKFSLRLSEKELISPPSRPGGKSSKECDWVCLKPFWLTTGPLKLTDWADANAAGICRFVITPTVDGYIRDIGAAVAANVAPILLQGPTSVGKTTMIEYLAARTGHKCVRINNHEHTDVQEYIGGYVSNLQGNLEFRDGLLVEALRNGYWIILDELNLAPSDVLEALNRLLDDNKELYIAETGEIVKPAKSFQLFATQNPPGAYGGRKPLSRAFKNRFIELTVNDLPLPEIESIVTSSCGIAPKYAKMLVKTMQVMQMKRQQSTLFQGKHGIVTLRDLVKWGKRQPQSPMDVATDGFMILAEKLRVKDDSLLVLDILQDVCKVKVEIHNLYAMGVGDEIMDYLSNVQSSMRLGQLKVDGVGGIAITETIQRMWKLVYRGLQHSEPLLLVGTTGTGKTTVCQLYAAHTNQRLRVLNCHQSTETSDIIGGLRPVRGRDVLLTAVFDQFASIKVSLTELSTELNLNSTYVDEIRCVIAAIDSANRGDENSIKLVLDQLSSWIANMMTLQNADNGDESPSKRLKLNANNQSIPSYNETISHLNLTLQTCHQNFARYVSLFEWQDGPLVTAMKEGDVFLLDEINLAEDAVIERLNSVLESSREITLAEKGGGESDKIVAHPRFKFLATMNPGGDFGKRELSPALRSRFSEVWIPQNNNDSDLTRILVELIRLPESCSANSADISSFMVSFINQLNALATSKSSANSILISNRELLAWAKYISQMQPSDLPSVFAALVNGAHMVLLDGLGTGSSLPRETIAEIKRESLAILLNYCPEANDIRKLVENSLVVPESSSVQSRSYSDADIEGADNDDQHNQHPAAVFQVGSFSIPLGPLLADNSNSNSDYVLSSKNTLLNLTRILRAMQIPRPILLEGPPGVGKSSIIANLAKVSGHTLVRINLSEHSELSDLLGTDLPLSAVGDGDDISSSSSSNSAQGGGGGSSSPSSSSSSSPKFVWCDGVFLKAMKRGDWVLLDELNLAPQSVLEGLNACLDHREEVFLPEIGQVVKCAPSFRVFCAQNPMLEGGGRKGLPQSFLSRFSRVFVESMTKADMEEIMDKSFNTSNDIPAEDEVEESLSEDVSANMSLHNVDKIATAVVSSSLSMVVENTTSSSVSTSQFLKVNIPLMVHFVTKLHHDVVKLSLFGRSGGPWEFNLRDIIRWCQFIQYFASSVGDKDGCDNALLFRSILCEGAHFLFALRFRALDDQRAVCDIFSEVFGYSIFVSRNFNIGFVQASRSYKAGLASLPIDFSPRIRNCNSSFVNGVPVTDVSMNKLFESLAECVSLSWPVLLIGPHGSNKRRLVRELASQTGNVLMEISVTSSTDSTDLLGSFEQINSYRYLNSGVALAESLILALVSDAMVNNAVSDSIKNLAELFFSIKRLAADVSARNSLSLPDGNALFSYIEGFLSDLLNYDFTSSRVGDQFDVPKHIASIQMQFTSCFKSSTSSSFGGFEWVDGIVVKSLEAGNWLLINNVNICPASVLDRLNSLLEPKGSILLTEAGQGRVIRPHPSFRIFFVMDPINGEISRAMRNRCVEIHVQTAPSREELMKVALQQYSVHDKLSSNELSMVLNSSRVFSLLASMQSINEISDTSKSSKSRRIVSSSSASFQNSVRLPFILPFRAVVASLIDSFMVEYYHGQPSMTSLERSLNAVLPTLFPFLEVETTASNASSNGDMEGASASGSGEAKNDEEGEIFIQHSLLLSQQVINVVNFAKLSNNSSDSAQNLAPWIKKLVVDSISSDILSIKVSHSSKNSLSTTASAANSSTSTAGMSYSYLIEVLAMINSEFERDETVATATTQLETFSKLVFIVSQLLSVSSDLVFSESNLHLKAIFNAIPASLQGSFKECYDTFLSLPVVSNVLIPLFHQINLQRLSQSPYFSLFLQSRDSFNSNNAAYVFWMDFVQLTYFSRFDVIEAERLLSEGVKNETSLSIMETIISMITTKKSGVVQPSLYYLGLALEDDSIASDSTDKKTLRVMIMFLNIIDRFIAMVTNVLIETYNASSSIITDVFPKCLELVKKIVTYRDMLSSCLRGSLLELSPNGLNIKVLIPWGGIVSVAIWINETLKETSTSDISTFNPGFVAALQWFWGEVHRLDASFKSLWHQSIFTDEGKLWKEGGHLCLPSAKHLPVLERFLNIFKQIRPTKSPHFVDSVEASYSEVDSSSSDSNSNSSSSSSTTSSAAAVTLLHSREDLKELLALYSTFLVSKTKELSIYSDFYSNPFSSKVVVGNNSSSNNINIKSLRSDGELDNPDASAPISSSFKQDLDSFDALTLIDAIELKLRAKTTSGLVNTNNNAELSSSSNDTPINYLSAEAIAKELDMSSDLPMAMFSDLAVIRAMRTIASLLSLMLMSPRDEDQVLTHCIALVPTCQFVVEVSIRYSKFDVGCLRECQTLLWCAESVLETRDKHRRSRNYSKLITAHLSDLISLCKVYQPIIQSTICRLESCNVINFIDSSSISHDSPSILKVMVASRTGVGNVANSNKSRRVDFKQLNLSFANKVNGSIRKFQLVETEILQKLLDPAVLFPGLRDTPLGSVLSGRETALVNLATHKTAVNNMSRLLRHSLICSATASSALHSSGVFTTVATLIDILWSSRDIFSADFVDEVLTKALFNMINHSSSSSSFSSSSSSSSSKFNVFGANSPEIVKFNGMVNFFKNFTSVDYQSSINYSLASTVSLSVFNNCVLHAINIVSAFPDDMNHFNLEDSFLLSIWVGLAQMHLTVPQIPVDPASKSASKHGLLSSQLRRLDFFVSSKTSVESLYFGTVCNENNNKLMSLRSEIQATSDKLLIDSFVRSKDAVLFDDLYQELHGAFDSADTEGLFSAPRLSKLVTDIQSRSQSIFNLTSSEQHDMADGEYHALEELVSYESSWQDSSSSFIRRLEDTYAHYADILSTIVAGHALLSSGLRNYCASKYMRSSDVIACRSTNATSKVQNYLKTVLQFPLTIDTSFDNVRSSIFDGMKLLLVNHEDVVKRAVHQLAPKSLNSDASIQREGLNIRKASTHLLLTYSLSQIDYYTRNNIISDQDYAMTRDLTKDIFNRFIELYLAQTQEKLHNDLVKQSLFKNKAVVTTLDDDAEAAEDRYFRLHFPDHRKEYDDIVNVDELDGLDLGDSGVMSMDGGDNEEEEEGGVGNGASGGGAGDENNDGSGSGGDVNISLSEFNVLDDTSCSFLVNIHARLVFLYSNGQPLEKPLQMLINERQGGGSGKDWAASSESLKLSFMDLWTRGILLSKSLELGWKNLLAISNDDSGRDANIESQVTSGRNAAFAFMMSNLSKSTNHFTVSKTGKSVSFGHNQTWMDGYLGTHSLRNVSSLQAETLDRDLLLLLDDQTLGTSWRPVNFHTEPDPTQASRVIEPVINALNRVNELLGLYPNHQVLVQISKLASRISREHVTVSIGKLLSSIELLLKKCEEWEQVAASHVSLQPFLSQLQQVIGLWRQIELKSWDNLLRSKEVEYARKAMKLWFKIARTFLYIPEFQQKDITTSWMNDWTYLGSQGNINISSSNSKPSKSSHLWPVFRTWCPNWLAYKAGGGANVSNSSASASEVGLNPSSYWLSYIQSKMTVVKEKKRIIINHTATYFGSEEYQTQLKADIEAEEKEKETEHLLGSESEFLFGAFETVEGFLRQSSIGEFPTRLHMVRMFALQLLDPKFASKSSEANNSQSSDIGLEFDANNDDAAAFNNANNNVEMRPPSVEEILGRIAYGIWEFYHQFLHPARDFMKKLKDPLQERLQNEIKMGKWDNMSVYSLIEFSEKIHRKLSKIIREYQSDVLDYPLHAVIQQEIMSDLINVAGEAVQSVGEIPSDSKLFPIVNSLENGKNYSFNAQFLASLQINRTILAESSRMLSSVYGVKLTTFEESMADVGVGSGKIQDGNISNKIRRLKQYAGKMDGYLQELFKIPDDSFEFLDEIELPLIEDAVTDGMMDTEVSASSASATNASTDSSAELSSSSSIAIIDVPLPFEGKLRFGLYASYKFENVCSFVFDRIGQLRNGKDIPKAQKYRAVSDFIETIQDLGVSTARVHSPYEAKEFRTLFTMKSPMSSDIAKDLTWGVNINNFATSNDASAKKKKSKISKSNSSSSASLNSKESDVNLAFEVFAKGESYFVKTMSELQQLRVQVVSPISPDVSTKDSKIMLNLTENMFTEAIKMRCVIGASLDDFSLISKNFRKLVDVSQSFDEKADRMVIRENVALIHMKRSFDARLQSVGPILIDNLKQCESLLDSDSFVNMESADVIELDAVTSQHMRALSNFPSTSAASKSRAFISELISLSCKLCSVSTANLSADSSSYIENFNSIALEIQLLKLHLERELRGTMVSVLTSSFVDSLHLRLTELLQMIQVQIDGVNSIQAQCLSDSEASASAVATNGMEISERDDSNSDNSSSSGFDVNNSIELQKLVECIDVSLIAVQRLRSFVGDAFVDSEANRKQKVDASTKPLQGCFNETIDLSSSDSMSAMKVMSLANYSFSCFEFHKIYSKTSELLVFIDQDLSIFKDEAACKLFSYGLKGMITLLHRLISCYFVAIQDQFQSYKSLSKFVYISSRIFRNLLAKGICAPNLKEEDGGGEGSDNKDGEWADGGEGMAAGCEGQKDVSDQIENEDQVMGLKNEEKPEKESKEKNRQLDKDEMNQGVEMSDDFDGEICDIPDQENNESGEESEDDEEDNKDDLDRDMGDADLEDIVDEKQWNDEEDGDGEDGNNEEEEKFENNSKMNGEKLDEMRTKEEGEDDGKKDDPKKDPKQKDNSSMEEEEEEGGDDNGNDEKKINEDKEENKMDKPQGLNVREEEKFGDDEDEDEQKDGDGDDDNDALDKMEEEEKKENDEEDGPGHQDLDDGGEKEAENNGDDANDDLPEDLNLDGGDDAGDDDDDEGADKDPEDLNDSDADDANDMNVSDDEASDDKDKEPDEDEMREENLATMSGAGNQDEEEPDPSEDKEEEEEEKEKEKDKEKKKPNQNSSEKKKQPMAYGTKNDQSKESVLGVEEDDPNKMDDQKDEGDDANDSDEAEDNNGGEEGSSSSKPNSKKKSGQDDSNKPADNDNDETNDNDDNDTGNNLREKKIPNPFRKKGDINKAWHRRLNIMDENKDNNKEEGQDGDDGSDSSDHDQDNNDDDDDDDDGNGVDDTFKFSKDDDGYDPNEKQVLAEASEEDLNAPNSNQFDKENEISKKDKEKKDEKVKEEKKKPEKPPLEKPQSENKESTQKPKKNPSKAKEPMKDESDEESAAEDSSGNEMDENSNSDDEDDDDDELHNAFDDDDFMVSKDYKVHTNADYLKSDKPFDEDETVLEDSDRALLIDMDGFDLDSGKVDESHLIARQKWLSLRLNTESLSIRLCEQLRLILEPTLQTRLKGDYRTGKRINMRKVIGYVASGYRKDKIWLRRTKPAGRNYQIMLMMDNSRSMKSEGASDLALNSLASIATALTRLEVGDLSIVSFAEGVKVVHKFGDAFFDEAGVKVMKHFDFSSEGTLLGDALEGVLPIFQDSKDASTAASSATCLQLLFIVSDARIDSDNRQRLEKTIRKYAEENILVVFILLDLPQKSAQSAAGGGGGAAGVMKKSSGPSSVFDMKTVDFTPEGKIVSKDYMSDFPFPFYIAIQHIETIPEVLTGALKQWFEMMTRQNN